MSTIKPAELRIIDRVMGMEAGYVLDFSDRTFAQFFDHEMGVDIDSEVWRGNGTSKAKRLRAYLQLADDNKAAKVLRALDDYRLTASIQSANPDGELVQRFLSIVERLSGCGEGAAPEIFDDGAIHAFERDESLSDVIAAIQRDMQADRPQAVMDRLHTYCMKRLAHLIRTNDPDAELPDSLPGRAGKYLNSPKANAKETNPFSFAILKHAGFVFEQLNFIRNKNSLAHDNELLSKAEARFVFQAICNVLSFIKSIEGHRFDS